MYGTVDRLNIFGKQYFINQITKKSIEYIKIKIKINYYLLLVFNNFIYNGPVFSVKTSICIALFYICIIVVRSVR